MNLAEARLDEKTHGLRASLAGTAMDNNFVRRVELVHAPRDVAQGDKLRAGYLADLVFVRLADVHQDEGLPLVHHLLDLERRNLRHGDGHNVVFAAHAAELVVVNQLRDRRMRAANRAVRVLAKFELAKLQVKRVEEQ